MKLTVVLLGVVLSVSGVVAAEQSCASRCGSFNPDTKCQCDSMCAYYGSCCPDYDTVCPKKARGDTFDEEWTETMATTRAPPSPSVSYIPTVPTVPMEPMEPMEPTVPSVPSGPTGPSDLNATVCSGQPFDAFLQLKNGSIYAFRGEYFFELDDKSILPGYPKLIEDVWGIPGPIDAAFTRINCQGKTYIFKGNRYWRFEGDVLDDDFPRDISMGFNGIPSNIDAAFAIPAPSHSGREKAYFFKDNKYYRYEFKKQPTHEQCVAMTRSSPSVLFTRYTELFCDQTFEDLFSDLFGNPFSSNSPIGPRPISREWMGVNYPVDAAMVGRVKLTPKPTPSPPPVTNARRYKSRRRRPNKKRGARRSHYMSFEDIFDDLFDFGDFGDYIDYTDQSSLRPVQQQQPQVKPTPAQSVYFFTKDKYTRVDLRKRRVDVVHPPYPRSIATYWLGCENEETPDTSRAEK